MLCVSHTWSQHQDTHLNRNLNQIDEGEKWSQMGPSFTHVIPPLICEVPWFWYRAYRSATVLNTRNTMYTQYTKCLNHTCYTIQLKILSNIWRNYKYIINLLLTYIPGVVATDVLSNMSEEKQFSVPHHVTLCNIKLLCNRGHSWSIAFEM